MEKKEFGELIIEHGQYPVAHKRKPRCRVCKEIIETDERIFTIAAQGYGPFKLYIHKRCGGAFVDCLREAIDGSKP